MISMVLIFKIQAANHARLIWMNEHFHHAFLCPLIEKWFSLISILCISKIITKWNWWRNVKFKITGGVKRKRWLNEASTKRGRRQTGEEASQFLSMIKKKEREAVGNRKGGGTNWVLSNRNRPIRKRRQDIIHTQTWRTRKRSRRETQGQKKNSLFSFCRFRK